MKKILIGILMLLLTASFALAATFGTPSSSDTIRGNTVFNASSTMDELVNCSFIGSSAAASDTLSTTTMFNSSLPDWVNATVDTTLLLDATDWTFSGTCYNSTGDSETLTAITSITIDNAVPSLTLTSGQATGGRYSQETAWTATCTNTTSATIDFGVNSYSMSKSGNTCTYTPTSVPPAGYDITITATDGTNSTTLSYTGVTLYREGSAAKGAIALQQAGKLTAERTAAAGTSNTTGIIVIILIVVAIYLFQKKKK